MIPMPALPEPLAYVLWTLFVLSALLAGFWRLLRWHRGQVREAVMEAFQSEALERIVDKRVTAAFDGAVGPLLRAQGELSGQVAIAQKSADAAHRRIDTYLDKAR